EDLLGPQMRRLMMHTDARASLAPRSMTTSPPPACLPDADALCESPSPDVLMGQLAPKSPDAPMVAAERPARVHEAKVIVDDGTPPAEQIVALAEATIVDDTVYGEEEEAVLEPSMSIPLDEGSMAIETKVAEKEETEETEEEPSPEA